MRKFGVLLVALCAIGSSWFGSASAAAWEGPGVDTKAVEEALEQAGENAAELRQAIELCEPEQLAGLQFLIAHMPTRDLQSLSAEYLLENVRYAYRAWNEAPWKEQISTEMFFNEVLPYACINERRDSWRRDFYERFQPLVAEARTPAEAATTLNAKIFPLLDVHFSRERPKADQSPLESIKAGKASCSGLSVMLVDACRAVGVPARFVGTPLWANRSGNHSWVEIWDGQWHYTGAAEPNGPHLDRAWFTDRAKTAIPGHRLHAIYATSFQPTEKTFPLVWDRGIDYVHAVDVTERYIEPTAVKPAASAEAGSFDVEASMHAVRQLKAFLEQPETKLSELNAQDFATVALTRDDAAEATELLWQIHRERAREERAEEMEKRVIVGPDGKLEMPFHYSVAGEAPENGRSLYISMHGGGGAPTRVNDRQWENQKRLYEVPEGVYLAPRAPTDAWNLWHQAHIDPMFDRLIEDLVLFEGVDPNRVYLMGYSAGGDGVYQVAPRMADRLAAASMMAGHPNEASPLGLRNLPFSIQVGGDDAAYDRNKVAVDWNERLDKLREEDPEGYPHWAKIYEGKGHWMDREDAQAIPWMAKQTRNPWPDRVVWNQDDVTHTRFYWLAVPEGQAKPRTTLIAERDRQTISLSSDDVASATLRLADDLVDLDQPVRIVTGDRVLFEGSVSRTIESIARSLQQRLDPTSVAVADVTVDLAAE